MREAEMTETPDTPDTPDTPNVPDSSEKQKPTPNHRLRRERERRAWSQQELADEVGTTPLNVGRWERGVTQPNPYFRRKLSEVFGKSAQELGLVSTKEPDDTIALQETAAMSSSAGQEAAPTYWNVPYRRSLFFTGREDILTQLRDAFTSDTATIALAQPQAISGLGGIGKTQTAIEYAYRYRDSYQAVFWVRAESPDLLVSDYSTLATLLTLPERNEQDQSQITSAVIRWFDTHDSWLLILDNADELDAVSEYIPSAGKGHILLTTRAQAVGTLAQRIDIDKLSLDDGVTLLLRRIKRLRGNATLESVPTSLRQQAQAIVEAVDCLPLALDQAGAYIEETSCSLSDYLKFYKTRRTKLLRMRGRDVGGHPEPVAATWSLAFENIERANPAAADLLRLCAFLHPDAIPESMIVEGASELGPTLGPIAADELDLNEAIGQLLRYSLVKRDADENVLNMHRLVQAVVRDGMKDDDERVWAERMVKMMNKVFPIVEFKYWDICQRYLPHAQLCYELIQQWHIVSIEAGRLLNNLGDYLQERGNYTDKVFQLALTVRQTMGIVDSDLAESFNNLAHIHHVQGKYPEAEQLQLRAIDIWQQTGGPIHLDVATGINNLASIYEDEGKYEQAEKFFQQALDIRTQLLGSSHATVADSLNNLGFLYGRLGRYEQAELMQRQAIVIWEQELGSMHPRVAVGINNLAILCYKSGEKEEAAYLTRKALEIREQIFGPLHPEVAASCNNLGFMYDIQGNYELSEHFYLRALTIKEQTLRPDHPDVATGLSNLAALYRGMGKYELAESHYKRALRIYEQALGASHPYIARSLNGLARLYEMQKRYEEAEKLFEQALTIREKSLGYSHPDVADTLEYYAGLLRKTNRDVEAEVLEARAQSIRAKQS